MPARIDTAVLRALRTRGHHPAAERAVLAWTSLGNHGALWYALAGVGAAVDGDRRDVFVRAAAAVGGAYVANQAIKVAVRRRRPRLAELPPLVKTGSQISYPSAHASTSFAGARALAVAWPGVPVYAAAVAMAVSRAYVGVHYPSDLVAGAVLGTAVAELAR